MIALTPELAARFRATALDNVTREFPNKLDHVMNGEADVASPRALHPAFYGSYDWHSCVHMHWLLARLLATSPALDVDDAIAAVFDAHLSREAIAGEVAYLGRAGAQAFERTYGWAWLLKLAETLRGAADLRFRRWQANLAPLEDAISARYLAWLPKARQPLRTGLHANSAFGLSFALDYARAAGESRLATACESKAIEWYGGDRDYPAAWEPSGSDFFSPALVEADLMRRVLGRAEFAGWLDAFLPALADRVPTSLFSTVRPTDRGDGQIVHLDGLNLSRAWCFRGIAQALVDDRRCIVLERAADEHLAAGLEGVASADYMGSHWLATFALLALHGG